MFTTAGVIVIDPNTKELLIMKSKFNEKKWSFSKGYIEKNEIPIHCALRELCEEKQLKLDTNDLLEETYTMELTLPKPTKKIPSGKKIIKFYVAYLDKTVPILLSREHSKYAWVSDFTGFDIHNEFVKIAQTIQNSMNNI